MRTVEISPKTIIFTVFFLIGLYLIWILQDLIFSLFIAFIIMSALRPIVEKIQKRKVPHGIAVFLVYICFILLFIFLFSIIIPPIIIEVTNLIINLPSIVQSISPSVSGWIDLNSLTQYIPTATNQVFQVLSGIFSNIFFVISTLFFGFYFLLEENIIKRFFLSFVSEERAHSINSILVKAENRMSSWFWGEIMLMTVVGLLTFIGLNIIGIKYALALAVLAGLLEVVPNVGPILAAIPAFLIGLSQSQTVGLSSLAVSFIVQQLENNLVVPLIMRHAVGLNPILTLISLIIGGRIGGVLGVLLAIPAFLFIETFVSEFLKDRKIAENLR